MSAVHVWPGVPWSCPDTVQPPAASSSLNTPHQPPGNIEATAASPKTPQSAPSLAPGLRLVRLSKQPIAASSAAPAQCLPRRHSLEWRRRVPRLLGATQHTASSCRGPSTAQLSPGGADSELSSNISWCLVVATLSIYILRFPQPPPHSSPG